MVGGQAGGEPVFLGQVAFHPPSVVGAQHALVHDELGHLADGVLVIVVIGPEFKALGHEPVIIGTLVGLPPEVARVIGPCGGVGVMVQALVDHLVNAPIEIAAFAVVHPAVEIEAIRHAVMVAEEPVASVRADHALALPAPEDAAVAGYPEGGVALVAPFFHLTAVPEIVARPHAVAFLEVDHRLVVQGGFGGLPLG